MKFEKIPKGDFILRINLDDDEARKIKASLDDLDFSGSTDETLWKFWDQLQKLV